MQALQSKLKQDPGKLLDEHRDLISRHLEKEIIPRYYLQKGKIEKSLQVDLEIQEAIRLLGDPARYEALLKKK
jgi:carboxyl-terminal processing protease